MSVALFYLIPVCRLLQAALMVFDICHSGLNHHPNNDDESERSDESNDSLDRMRNNVPDGLPRIICHGRTPILIISHSRSVDDTHQIARPAPTAIHINFKTVSYGFSTILTLRLGSHYRCSAVIAGEAK
jgi:hypothetical protein